VALARALIRQPQLLLLDEPLSALDSPARLRLGTELRQLLRELAIPTLLVTHTRAEALALGDQLVVIDSGRIVQQGAVHEVFSRPASVSVAEIVAVETIQLARVSESREGLVTVVVGQTKLVSLSPQLPPGTEVYVCIRAEDVILVKGNPLHSSPRNALTGTVTALKPEGPVVRVDLDCGFRLSALLTKQACEEMALQPGNQILALIKAPHLHLIRR
jgi:molybdate transport system ATP-binding protein